MLIAKFSYSSNSQIAFQMDTFELEKYSVVLVVDCSRLLLEQLS